MSRIVQAKQPSEFRARDIANIVNALARVGVWDEALFRKLSAVVRGMSAEQVPLCVAACVAAWIACVCIYEYMYMFLNMYIYV